MSLLIVTIIGSMMLLMAVSASTLALQSMRASQAQSDAVRVLYDAEDAFACVKDWINTDVRNFTNVAGLTIECNGVTYDFNGTADSFNDSHTPSYVASTAPYPNTGTGEFRIPYDRTKPNLGGVIVKVIRDRSKGYFLGKVQVLSDSESAGSHRSTQRFQEYDYRVLVGADIMFVVDRSGSVGGSRVGAGTGDWAALKLALDSSIATLALKKPQVQVGVVSFGTGVTDVGQAFVTPPCSAADCVRIPEIPLDLATAVVGSSIDTSLGHTNLSLGLGIAGAELLGRYYPVGTTTIPDSRFHAGAFERAVFRGGNIATDIPPQPAALMRDRPDTSYPDYIIIITDGEPNAIITSSPNTFQQSLVNTSNNFIGLNNHSYVLGETKLFRTPSPGAGQMIDDASYTKCSDEAFAPLPATILAAPNNTNTPPVRVPMCNSKLIADALKVAPNNITVGAIGVGISAGAKSWLMNDVVSDPGLYLDAVTFNTLSQSILTLFEQLDLLQSR